MDQDDWERSAITIRFRSQTPSNKFAVLVTFLRLLKVLSENDLKYMFWVDVSEFVNRMGKVTKGNRFNSTFALFRLLYRLNVRDGKWEFQNMVTIYPIEVDDFLKARRYE